MGNAVRFVRKKLVQLLIVLFAVTLISFLMINLLPGDTADVICGPTCDKAGRDAIREELGLNKPIPVRYGEWLLDAVTGDLGRSAKTKQPVMEAIRERLPVTLQLLVYSQFLALVIAMPAGIIAARRPNGLFDKASTGVVFLLLGIPQFVIAPLLIYFFAVRWNVMPAIYSKPEGFGELLKNLFLPAASLAAAEMAVYLRLLRSDMIATLQEDYIMMAKAKGLSNTRILLRHAFRPSTFSLVTIVGLNMGRLIGGSLIIEYIFAIPGIGRYAVDGIFGRDYLAVQGSVVVIAVGYVLINFAVDMLYAVLDPRIRHERAIL
jgi:peptide/nickel transport system permease protein